VKESRSTTARWHIGDVLRKLRHHMGWTLQQASAAGRLDVNVIHRIETGFTRDPREETLERLAEMYGMTLLQLRVAVPQGRVVCDPDAATIRRAESEAEPEAFTAALRRKAKTTRRV